MAYGADLAIVQALTAFTGLVTAAVKLYTQSTEQKRQGFDKEASDADPSEAHKPNGTAR